MIKMKLLALVTSTSIYHIPWSGITWKTCPGLDKDYTISHITLYKGNYREQFHTIYWSPMLWKFCQNFLLINGMNWLNSGLKYSGMSTFAEFYMCMSVVCFFCIIICAVAFDSLIEPHNNITGIILKC